MSNTPRWEDDASWKNDVERNLRETQLRLSRFVDAVEIPEVTNGGFPPNPEQWEEVYYRHPDSPYASWHLRWNENWGDAYGWEFIGGMYQWAAVMTDTTYTQNNTWVDAAVAGPVHTIRLPGYYNYGFGAQIYVQTQTALGQIAIGLSFNNGTGASQGGWDYAAAHTVSGIAVTMQNEGGPPMVPLVAEGDTVKIKTISAATLGGTAHVRFRWIRMQPQRVAAA